jgi:hypothetical protein
MNSQPLPPPPQVAGLSLSGTAPYTITADENCRVCRLSGTQPASDGTAHPVFFYIATQIGMGMTVAGLCAACEFDVNVGPLIAATRVELTQPLRVGVAYDIRGEIVSLTRKNSRKLGVMDLLEYQLHLHALDGVKVLSTTNTWVLPRGAVA